MWLHMMWKYTPLFVLPPSSVRAVEVFWHDHCWPIIYYNATPPLPPFIVYPIASFTVAVEKPRDQRCSAYTAVANDVRIRATTVVCTVSVIGCKVGGHRPTIRDRVHILRLVTSRIRSAVATGCERVVASDTGGAAATGLEAVVVTSQLTKGIRLQLASV